MRSRAKTDRPASSFGRNGINSGVGEKKEKSGGYMVVLMSGQGVLKL